MIEVAARGSIPSRPTFEFGGRKSEIGIAKPKTENRLFHGAVCKLAKQRSLDLRVCGFDSHWRYLQLELWAARLTGRHLFCKQEIGVQFPGRSTFTLRIPLHTANCKLIHCRWAGAHLGLISPARLVRFQHLQLTGAVR